MKGPCKQARSLPQGSWPGRMLWFVRQPICSTSQRIFIVQPSSHADRPQATLLHGARGLQAIELLH